MRVFKTTYTDRKGRTREATKWYVEFRDHLDTVRRLPAFTSKAASEEMGRNLVKLAGYFKGSGGQVDPSLNDWLTTLPPRVRQKLVEIGLLDRQRIAVSQCLDDHLSDWALALVAKGNSSFHVQVVTTRARKIVIGCGFRFYSEIKSSKVLAFLHDLRADRGKKRGISAQTFNFYLTAIKQFCRWMIRDGRAAENPIAHLDGLNVKTDRRRDRRALAVQELVNLLTTTATSPHRCGMSGSERALLYRLAVETGLRSGELRSLTRASFDLNGDPPTVTVEAAYSKHRREDTLPLRPELVSDLRPFLAMLAPAVPVFKIPKGHKEAAAMFKADIRAAGIDYRDDSGRVADFHALRHTFITNLANGGVHPKVAQALARHSTITLTMDRYSHTLVEEQSAALAALPDLTRCSETMKATGTDPAVLASCLALPQRFPETPVGADRRSGERLVESRSDETAAVSAVNPPCGSVCTSGEGPGLQNQWGV